MKSLLFLAALAACTSVDNDITGPFDGTVQRFTVDRLTFPIEHDPALALGDDLDGSGTIDNQLGVAVSALAGQADASTSGNDMIAAGVIRSVVEIQASDLTNDLQVGVTFRGAEGEPATVMGGAFVDGALRSNRSRVTQVPGTATVYLPVFADSDPSRLELQAMEIDLAPDGAGGFDAIIRGGIPHTSVTAAVNAGLRQMIESNPTEHSGLATLLDADHDGTISDDEIAQSSLVVSLISPDIFDRTLLSAAFGVHLVPCATGSCVTAPPADPCRDRVRDQDETDVDCGGDTCRPCPARFTCKLPSDCETTCEGGLCQP